MCFNYLLGYGVVVEVEPLGCTLSSMVLSVGWLGRSMSQNMAKTKPIMPKKTRKRISALSNFIIVPVVNRDVNKAIGFAFDFIIL